MMVVKEDELGPKDLEKLKCALPGLDIYNLALVWDFAQYLFRLQTSLAKLEKSKSN
ncbi:hypothetical protein ES705_33245 [subsurface metagenome]